QMVDVARQLTLQMTQSVEGLLALAQIGGGGLDLRRLDVGRLVGEAAAALADQLDGAATKLRVEPLPEVAGNAAQMRVLFQNLLANAVRFRDPERSLEIIVDAVPEEGAWRFRVQDNGSGLGAVDAGAIFEPLVRGGDGVDGGGVGLGLATCRRIVQRHGGQIGAYRCDVGTRFEFTWPAR
ncbi:MAG: ATP-binding protein, partial [Egicoccus sp.]